MAEVPREIPQKSEQMDETHRHHPETVESGRQAHVSDNSFEGEYAKLTDAERGERLFAKLANSSPEIQAQIKDGHDPQSMSLMKLDPKLQDWLNT